MTIGKETSQASTITFTPTSSKRERTDDRNSSPDVEILDLSRGPVSVTPTSRIGRASTSSSKEDRLDVELLDLSTRRDITVSAVPKTNRNRGNHATPSSHKAVQHDNITITPNHSNSRHYNSQRNASNVTSNNSNNAQSSAAADLSALLAGLPNQQNLLATGLPSALVTPLRTTPSHQP